MPILSGIRTLMFPPRCVGCGDLLEPFSHSGTVFCPLCRAAWEAAVTEAAGQASEDASRGVVYLTYYHSGRTDGIPERLIYHLKHQGSSRAFDFVADRLAPRVLEALSFLPKRETADGDKKPVLFTYPPRRRSAVNQDGFDQAARLAKALSATCSGEYAALIRRTYRRSSEQKQLNAQKRTDNALRSYELRKHVAPRVRGRIVVICDDLCTTGATLNRCAELLVNEGARLVILVTIAKTGGKNETDDKK